MIKYNKPCPIKYDGGGKTYTPKNPVGEQAMVAPIAVGAGNILPWVLGGLGITGATAHVLRNLGDVNFDFTLPKMIGMMGLANSYAHLTSGAQEAEKSEEKASEQTSAQAATPNNEDNKSKNEEPEKPNQQKKTFREKVADKIHKAADKVGGKKGEEVKPPLKPNKNSGFQRWLWETKGNHFENSIGSYPWRNTGRIVGGLTIIGGGSVGRGAGKIANYGKQQLSDFSKEVSDSTQTATQATNQSTIQSPAVEKLRQKLSAKEDSLGQVISSRYD